MSGGFFRGTSADQDTRFSNKQAKLLKSQKFPSVLDHLVDMTKVKMDVLRPWIAKRTTELLGFEDEVLINFVYGLLDAKEADGKKIQIQLTGFMEKNTGKFMKELWGLLLSAQNNVSGVPQQFLDEKEEETRKKKAETDRIAQEIQKRRDRDMDGRERERERKSRFDGEADNLRFTKIAFDPVSKFSKPRTPSVEPAVDREMDGSYGSRLKDGHSRSPPPNDHLPSPPRISPSPIRSIKKSVSRSGSYSGERHKSRSLSVSSMSERQSVSPGLRSQSPVGRSVSPKRRNMSSHMRSISPRKHSPQDNRSPTRRRSPHLRRRSRSRSRHRSPPYFRYRSPRARRSPRRRSRSPVRRRSPSPLRQRSPSPMRRRSPPPWRRRSPLPLRRRSPVKARRRSPSPVYQRSPVRRRSVSPVRHRTPPPLRGPSPLSSLEHQRRSPLHSPKKRTADSPISAHQRKRNYSPYASQSPPRRSRRSLSRERDGHAIGESRRYRDVQTYERSTAKRSLVSHASERQMYEHAGSGQKISESMLRKVPTSLRSPQHDVDYETKGRNRVPVVSPQSSPSQTQLPPEMPKVNQRKNRRSRSLSKSPVGRASVRVPVDSPMTNRAEKQMSYSREVSHHRTDSSHRSIRESPKNLGSKKPDTSNLNPESLSPDRRVSKQSPVTYGRQIHSESKKDCVKSDVGLPERNVQQLPYSSKEEEFGPGKAGEDRGLRCSAHDRKISAKLPIRDDSFIERHHEHTVESERTNQQLDDEYTESPHGKAFSPRSKKNTSKKGRPDRGGSDSEETDSYKNQNVERRRQKKSDKRKRYYDESSGSDSQIEDKKDAKRRKKDEKRLRKEEKRRRREEKHHRKLERRAGKLKLKSVDTVIPPSDFEKHYGDAADSDNDAVRRKNFHPSDVDEMESEQKQLEIELREKALESLRAKKATTH